MTTLLLLAHLGTHPACWCVKPDYPRLKQSQFYHRYHYDWSTRTPPIARFNLSCWRGFMQQCCCLNPDPGKEV